MVSSEGQVERVIEDENKVTVHQCQSKAAEWNEMVESIFKDECKVFSSGSVSPPV